MAFVLSMKNTFISISVSDDACEHGPVRRSSSVPKAWKPGDVGDHLGCTQSDESTDDASTFGDQDCSVTTLSDDNADSVKELDLHSAIVPEPGKRTRLKLSAQAYEPSLQEPPPEIHSVLSAVRTALSCCTYVSRVLIKIGSMGSATFIHAVLQDLGPMSVYGACQALSVAQGAFVDATARSQTVYIVGYASQPFVRNHPYGFKVTLSAMSASVQEQVCWDLIQHGFCPRRQTCRWNHPAKPDVLDIHVVAAHAGRTGGLGTPK
jgi:hypothetical protein